MLSRKVRFCAYLLVLGLATGCKEERQRQATTGGKAVATVYTPKRPELLPLPSAPAVKGLTPAQMEFWKYLEQFNRLPDNPSEMAIKVFKADGVPPEFRYLKESEESVLGNIEGLTAHREVFVNRYPWVRPLLEKYKITVPISKIRFSGGSRAIGKNYQMSMSTSYSWRPSPDNEKRFVETFLEGMLVLDYVFACGSRSEKTEAVELVQGVFYVNLIMHKFRNVFGDSLLTPASRDIGWPIIADFPELIKGQTVLLIRSGFADTAHAEKVNFGKWLLRSPGIERMKSENERSYQRGMIYNEQVRVGLLSYSIYTAHLGESARPEDSPDLVVLKILFERLFPKDHRERFNEYLKLLDAAYPKTNQ